MKTGFLSLAVLSLGLSASAQPCQVITLSPGSPLPGGDVGYPYSQTISAISSLHDQMEGQTGPAWMSNDFPTFLDYLDGEGADDFVVPAGQSFTVDTVVAAGWFAASSAASFNARFYADAGGVPGALECESIGSAFAESGGVFTITLLAPCALGPGTHWVSVQSNVCGFLCGYWYWNDVAVQAGAPAMWRNPGDYYGTGCTVFAPRSGCLGGAPDNAFRLLDSTIPAPTYTFAVTAGALPPGLVLDGATGVVSGTPTVAGTFTFTVTATDGGGCTGSRSYAVTIAACAITLSPPGPLPRAMTDIFYLQVVSASGGTAPHTYAVSGGALPPGLSMDTYSGMIQGQPTALGTFPFDVTAADVYGCPGTAAYAITVTCPDRMLPDVVFTQTAFAGTPYESQNFETAYDTFDCRGADDFAVPSGETWHVDGVYVRGQYDRPYGGYPPPASIDVTFFADDAGYPGSVIFAFPALTSFTDDQGSFTINLPATCTLGTGLYWVSIVANMDQACCGRWKWTENNTRRLQPAAWENPGGGFGTSCTPSWGRRMSCLGGAQDNAFRLLSSATPVDLPVAAAGSGYLYVFDQVGMPPFRFSLVAGSLPPGITLTPMTGRLQGVPTTLGSFAFTVSVSDTNACRDEHPYVITVGCAAFTPDSGSLPSGVVGAPYSRQLGTSGGLSPYTFILTGGNLPLGLSLTPTGLLSGVPFESGTFSFDVTVQDAVGCTGTGSFSLVIAPVWCGSIVLAPAALPEGTVGAPYGETVTASGGVAPYVFFVGSGTLPPGLTLLPFGLVTGTPSAPGTFSFAVTATDGFACAGSQSYTVTVEPVVNTVAGKGLGAPNDNEVRVYSSLGLPTSVDFLAYGAGAWGVNVASGDLDADGYGEIVTGPGPGQVLGPQVRGFLRTGTAIVKVNFFAYGTLRYGVNAAAADADADGFAELLSGPGPGAVFGPQVRGFDYDGAAIAPITKLNYFAYGTLRYGVNVAGGDLDVDGFAEIATGPGPGAMFGAQVRGWNYDNAAIAPIGGVNFNAFATSYGVNVAAGDVDADGYAELACAPGPGAANPAQFRGFDHDGSPVTSLPGYDVTAFSTLHGGRVGLGDVTSDGRADLLAAAGRDPVADSTVLPHSYDGVALVQLPGAFVAFGTSTYGVNVAGGAFGF